MKEFSPLLHGNRRIRFFFLHPSGHIQAEGDTSHLQQQFSTCKRSLWLLQGLLSVPSGTVSNCRHRLASAGPGERLGLFGDLDLSWILIQSWISPIQAARGRLADLSPPPPKGRVQTVKRRVKSLYDSSSVFKLQTPSGICRSRWETGSLRRPWSLKLQEDVLQISSPLLRRVNLEL